MKYNLSRAEKQRLCDLWNSRTPMLHKDIAKVMGKSRSWVWLVEQSAMAKLRKVMGVAA